VHTQEHAVAREPVLAVPKARPLICPSAPLRPRSEQRRRAVLTGALSADGEPAVSILESVHID
jgi:hypothetical protein